MADLDCSRGAKKDGSCSSEATSKEFKPLKVKRFVSEGVDGGKETSPGNGPELKIKSFVGTGVDGK